MYDRLTVTAEPLDFPKFSPVLAEKEASLSRMFQNCARKGRPIAGFGFPLFLFLTLEACEREREYGRGVDGNGCHSIEPSFFGYSFLYFPPFGTVGRVGLRVMMMEKSNFVTR